MKQQQRGGTAVGLIIGMIVGLGVALAVAVYVTKVPVPFLNKGNNRGSEQDEAQRNKNWDPNSPLYGKNPARPGVPATPGSDPSATGAVTPAPANPAAPAAGPVTAPPVTAAASAPRAAASKPATASADPLGDLAKARAAASPSAPAAASGGDPFDYFVQAGAFRTQADADAQRAKLAMLGWEARVSEREQNGRTVYRVRVGPFAKRDDADALKGKLDGAGVESALVRVQR